MSMVHLSYPLVAPSLLASSNDLLGGAKKALESGAKILHFDVMDGRFVPNHSFSLEEMVALKKAFPDALIDAHLMVSDPLLEAPLYAKGGAFNVTFHYEALANDAERHALIGRIHEAGAKAGMSVKPETDVSVLFPFFDELDLVLLMSVEPGKGGQAFLPASLSRMESLRKERESRGLSKKLLLEIDGGINAETGPLSLKAGVDILVAGSYLYKAPSFKEAMRKILL